MSGKIAPYQKQFMIAEMQETLRFINGKILDLKEPQNQRQREYFEQGGTAWDITTGDGTHEMLELMVKKAIIISALADLGAFYE